jgi:hypothetical protein
MPDSYLVIKETPACRLHRGSIFHEHRKAATVERKKPDTNKPIVLRTCLDREEAQIAALKVDIRPSLPLQS